MKNLKVNSSQYANLSQYFWDLALEDENTRLAAANQLLTQELNEEAQMYVLKRLVKGLHSPRDCARLGFSTALVQFLSVFTPDAKEVFELIVESTKVRTRMIIDLHYISLCYH
jgi:hypothetical protein